MAECEIFLDLSEFVFANSLPLVCMVCVMESWVPVHGCTNWRAERKVNVSNGMKSSFLQNLAFCGFSWIMSRFREVSDSHRSRGLTGSWEQAWWCEVVWSSQWWLDEACRQLWCLQGSGFKTLGFGCWGRHGQGCLGLGALGLVE